MCQGEKRKKLNLQALVAIMVPIIPATRSYQVVEVRIRVHNSGILAHGTANVQPASTSHLAIYKGKTGALAWVISALSCN